METPNYRKASIYFDDETVLEVEQRGGGGSGVGGDTGLSAVNLITGESTNAALAEKDETIEEQAGTIETQAATIIELQEELADVPTIEALNVTANGTYSETGKAYSPVNVNVAAEGLATVINRSGGLAWNIAHGTFTQISKILSLAGTTLQLSDGPDGNVPERPIFYGLKGNKTLPVVLCWLLTNIPSSDPRPSITIANPNIAPMFNISNQTINDCHAYAINFKAGYDFDTEPNIGHTLVFNIT